MMMMIVLVETHKVLPVFFYIVSELYFIKITKLKGENVPINNPMWEHFYMTLQYQNPQQFRVRSSEIKGAGMGLFFNRVAKKNQILCGYGGEVHLYKTKPTNNNNSNSNNYKALCSKTKYYLDAQNLIDKKNIRHIPLGHYINRPSNGMVKNTQISYLLKDRVLVVKAYRDIDTNNTWQELYTPYNLKKKKEK